MPNKFDLDYNTVTLDYQELIQTARIAMAYTKDRLLHRLNAWNGLSVTDQATKSDAEWMLRDAQYLAQATTTLYYLEKGRDRENVDIQNKGEQNVH